MLETCMDSMEFCLLFVFNLLFFMCLQVFCLHVCLYTRCVQCPRRPEGNVGSPRTEIREGYKPSGRYCKLNPGPLEE